MTLSCRKSEKTKYNCMVSTLDLLDWCPEKVDNCEQKLNWYSYTYDCMVRIFLKRRRKKLSSLHITMKPSSPHRAPIPVDKESERPSGRTINSSTPVVHLPATERPTTLTSAAAPTGAAVTTTLKRTQPQPGLDQPWFFKQTPPIAAPAAQFLKSAAAQNPSPNSSLNLASHHHHKQPQQGMVYPIASTGRGGFVARPKLDQNVTVANPAARSVAAPRAYPPQQLVRPYAIHNPDAHLLRPPYLHLSSSQLHPQIPIKAGYATHTVSDSNGITGSRGRSKNESFVMEIVHNRKVRISESSSLYALCRSWLRNGCHEETQLQCTGGASLLPRPPPSPMPQTQVSVEKDEEDGEAKGLAENLTEKDLLQRHITRAKRVRSRLREERLRRIVRYKTRLATLLPPQVEQFRDEMSGGT